MDHTIEPATSGRAKCRGCGSKIDKGELRLGERLPNPFADGLMTHWFHPRCAAYKRPSVMLELLAETDVEVPDRDTLEQAARQGAAHRRLPRVNGAGRAPTGRARCRSCREMIPKGDWRIALVYYEDGRFEPSGYIHLACSKTYFDTDDVFDRAVHFSPELEAEDVDALREALMSGPA